MDTQAGRRSLIAVITGFLAVVIVYFLVPSHPIVPKGIFLPLTKAMSPIPVDQVTLFPPNSAPTNYRTLGHLSVIYHAPQLSQQGQLTTESYAREISAKAGANGVIVKVFGHTGLKNTPSSQAVYILSGTAIHYTPNL